MSRLILASLVATAALASQPAFAQRAPFDMVEYHETVRYADLDLNRAEGRAVLVRRIGYAAERVCGGRLAAPFELAASQAYAKCYGAARTEAVRTVNAALLADAGKGGQGLRIAAR